MKKIFVLMVSGLICIAILLFILFKVGFVKMGFIPDATYIFTVNNLTDYEINDISFVVEDGMNYKKDAVDLGGIYPKESREVSVNTEEMKTQAGYIKMQYKNSKGEDKEYKVVNYFVTGTSGSVSIDIVSVGSTGDFVIRCSDTYSGA